MRLRDCTVHASQIYDWRKQHRQKLQAGKRSALLPVQVAKGAPLVVSETKQECSVVIEARNVRMAVSGYVDAVIIRTLVECLAR